MKKKGRKRDKRSVFRHHINLSHFRYKNFPISFIHCRYVDPPVHGKERYKRRGKIQQKLRLGQFHRITTKDLSAFNLI